MFRLSARTALFLLALSVFFVCAGVVLIRYPGLQNDEVFFAPPIFQPQIAWYSINADHVRIPLMVMSYTGALKTWLYAGIFSVWAPSRASVRIPMVLACVAGIWLTWLWARALGGTKTAIAAAVLLATDAMFLLTGIFDWGPVALQHLLLLAGLVCLAAYVRSSRRSMLALGFFFWGLGLWDKALMIWLLSGLAIAALVVYPREVRRWLTPATAAIALGACLLGAAPLVWYNLDRHGETATANAVFSADKPTDKLIALERTLDGDDLIGYMVDEHTVTPGKPPRGIVERVSFALRRFTGVHPRNWFLPVFAASIVLLVFLRRSRHFRPMLFLLIAMAIAWLQMFLTHSAGASAHHVILLWPLPFVFTGLALAAVAESVPRYGAAIFAAIVALLVIGNVLNENEYLARLAIRGGVGPWTDAIFRLSDSLNDSQWVGAVDWGYANSLRTLHEGRIKLFTTDENDPASVRKMVTNPDLLYVEHAGGAEIIPRVNEQLQAKAAALGYSEHVLRIIPDSDGAPVFELFRFESARQSASLN